MKMKLVLWMCLMMTLSFIAHAQNVDDIIVTVDYAGMAPGYQCTSLDQTMTFTTAVAKIGGTIITQDWSSPSNDCPLWDPVQMIHNYHTKDYPIGVALKVVETTFMCCFLPNLVATKTKTLPWQEGNGDRPPYESTVDNNDTGSGSMLQPGYRFSVDVKIPRILDAGFNTYADAGYSVPNLSVCYGDPIYGDTGYKDPAFTIRNNRFMWEYSMPGNPTIITYVTENLGGKIAIPSTDLIPLNPTGVTNIRLRVKMIGPKMGSASEPLDGLHGEWSPYRNLTLYPPAPAFAPAGIEAQTFSDGSSRTITSTDGSVTVIHVGCSGGNDGQIKINRLNDTDYYQVFVSKVGVPGANMSFKAHWSPSVSNPIVIPDSFGPNPPLKLDAGQYDIQVQALDAGGNFFGCSSTKRIEIKQPPAFSIAPTKFDFNSDPAVETNVRCGDFDHTGRPSTDGRITVTPTGGLGPFQYTLVSHLGNAAGPQVGSRQVVTFARDVVNLFDLASKGTDGVTDLYYVVIADDAGHCHRESPAMVLTTPEKIVITQIDRSLPNNAGTNIKCFGGTDDTQVFITGGIANYNSTVDSGQPRISTLGQEFSFIGLAAGTHTIQTTDQIGCVQTLQFNFTQHDKIEVDTELITPANCFESSDGAIKVNAKGGATFAGDAYKYSLTYAPGVIQQAAEASFTSLVKNSYDIKIEDQQGCSQIYTRIITAPTELKVTTTKTDVICFGTTTGSVQANFLGGITPYALDWLDKDHNLIKTVPASGAGNNTLTERPFGDHYARIKDAHGCTKESFITISQPAAALDVQPVPGTTLDVTCNGLTNGAVTMQASGGWSSYLFGSSLSSLHANPAVQDLPAGVNKIYVQDLNGCVDSFDVTIAQPAALTVSIDDVDGVSCFGDTNGAFTPTVAGGTSPYQVGDASGTWISPTRLIGLAPGNFHLMVRDAQSCETSKDVMIVEPVVLDADIASITDTKCGESNGAVEVDVTGGTLPYSAEWKLNGEIVNTDVNPTGLPAGLYDVEIIDSHDCRVPLTAPVSSSDGPVIETLSTKPVTCADGRDGGSEISVTGGITPYVHVSWSSGEEGLIAATLVKGINFITVEDQAGCISAKQIIIDGPGLIDGNFTAVDPTCFGDSDGSLVIDAIGGVGPYQYDWIGTSNTSDHANALAAGDYNVSITDSKGCNRVIEYTLAQPDPVSVTLSGKEIICTGMQTTLDAGNPGATYEWTSTNNFTSSERIITIDKTGAYTVVVTDATGCTGTATFELSVDSNLLNADFLAASEVAAGDTLVFINITFPAPDSSSWSFPDGGQVVQSTYYTQEVVFADPGTYAAILYASIGDCHDDYQASVLVIEPEDEGDDEDSDNGRKSSLVRSFNIHPNPSNGRFTVTVDLDEEMPLSLDVISMKAVSTQARYSDYGKDHYQIDVSLDVSPGMYTVMLNVGGEKLAKRIIIY